MKISHYMLFVAALMFTWLTASYLTPIPSETYEHAKHSKPATQEVIVAHSHQR